MHFSQWSGSGKWGCLLLCTYGCCLCGAESCTQFGGKLAKAWRLPLAETTVDWNGGQLLCLCYSCCAEPTAFWADGHKFCYSPAYLQGQSLVLNSFQPNLKQGQCFIAAVLLWLHNVKQDGAVIFGWSISLQTVLFAGLCSPAGFGFHHINRWGPSFYLNLQTDCGSQDMNSNRRR